MNENENLWKKLKKELGELSLDGLYQNLNYYRNDSYKDIKSKFAIEFIINRIKEIRDEKRQNLYDK